MDSKGVLWFTLLHAMSHKKLPSFAQFLSQEQKDFWENILPQVWSKYPSLWRSHEQKAFSARLCCSRVPRFCQSDCYGASSSKKSSEMKEGGGGWLCHQGPQSHGHPRWGLRRQRERLETLGDQSRQWRGREVNHPVLGCWISTGISHNCTGLSHVRRWK